MKSTESTETQIKFPSWACSSCLELVFSFWFWLDRLVASLGHGPYRGLDSGLEASTVAVSIWAEEEKVKKRGVEGGVCSFLEPVCKTNPH